MADVLRGLALAGQGVAWLPGVALPSADRDALDLLDTPADGRQAVDSGAWSVHLATVAVTDRTARRPALDRLWDRLAALAPHPTTP